jgi:cephalosporin-C deacetylase-like acetyl esterase
MLPDYIRGIATGYYDERDRRLKKITTAETLAARQEEVRGIYRDILGPFPARTPLNVRQVGQIEQDGYTIEKLIYESQPQFYTTANLYRPNGEGRFPALICPVGHWQAGKANEDYQALGAGLARSGCIALIYDAPGQGERLTYYDPLLDKSWMGATVTDEHSMVGYPCFLTGSHLAMHMIWNGMCGIDLLQEREDVGPERIGCTGSSGGGTLTRLIASLDDRVKVAIPVCATGAVRVVGAGDAEQNMFTALSRGMCPTDLYWAIAPRPLMMITATGDGAYEGAQETLADVRQPYGILERLNWVDHVEIEGRHGYIEGMRLAAREWLARCWGVPRPPAVEEEVVVLPEDALICTETGQVSTSLGGETVFTLNRRIAEQVAPSRPDVGNRQEAERFQKEVRRLAIRVSGFQEIKDKPGVEKTVAAHPEEIVYQSEKGIRVPGRLFWPEGEGPHPAVVFVHGQGNEGAATSGWPQKLVGAGLVVLTIDFRGIGETAPPLHRDGGHPYDAFLLGSQANISRSALYVGRSLFGMRVADVMQGTAYLRSRSDIDGVSVVGTGAGGLLALYAGALDDEIQSVAVHRGLYAYRPLIAHPFYSHPFSLFLPGVLKSYDLGDIAGLVAPRPLLVVNPVDEADRPANVEAVAAEYRIAREVYSALGGPDKLTVARTESIGQSFKTVGSWVLGKGCV